MHLERIKGSFFSLISLKIFQKSYTVRLLSFPLAVKCTIFLILTFCLLSFSEKDIELRNKQDAVPEKILNINEPNERAVEWLLYLVELRIDNQHILTKQLNFTKTLWSDNYKHKDIIVSMTKIEISQIEGIQQSSIEEVEKIIQSLENSKMLTKAEEKILCLNYILYAGLSKYFKAEKKGLEYCYKAIDIAKKNNFPSGKLLAHNYISQLLGYTNSNLQLGIEHLKKGKAQLDDVSKNFRQIFSKIIANNIASAWSELGQMEKAIDTRLKILDDEKNWDNRQYIIVNHIALGTDYLKLEKYDLAKKYLEKSIKLINKYNILKGYKGMAMIKLGLINIECKNISIAQNYSDSLDNWLKTYKLVSYHKITYCHLKSKLAKANNDLEQAVQWLEQATVERDSLKKIIGPNGIIQLEEQSKFSEIQKEKLALEKSRNLNKSTISTQKKLLYAGIIILLLSALFYNYLYKRKEVIAQDSSKKITSEKLSATSAKNPESKEIDQDLMRKIELSLKEEKLFLSQGLTLKKFADHLDSNTSYLSKTINAGFQKNFNALINDYRIEEVLRLFDEGEYQTFTIESIYQKAGFKSKSSFQKSFKAKTGQTASHYLNNLKLNKTKSSEKNKFSK